MDLNELNGFIRRGKLTALPAKRKKKLAALLWITDHTSPKETYTEAGFNALLDALHSFDDPATLRRELCDAGLVERSADGTRYRLDPDRPAPEALMAAGEEPKTAAAYSDGDLKSAAEFREQIHAEALRRVRQFRPEVTAVIDRYSVESYFQQHWDYPGAWYTIVAIPESAGSREALIETIVRDTLAGNW